MNYFYNELGNIWIRTKFNFSWCYRINILNTLLRGWNIKVTIMIIFMDIVILAIAKYFNIYCLTFKQSCEISSTFHRWRWGLQSSNDRRFTASTQQNHTFERETMDRWMGIVSPPLNGPRLLCAFSSSFCLIIQSVTNSSSGQRRVTAISSYCQLSSSVSGLWAGKSDKQACWKLDMKQIK